MDNHVIVLCKTHSQLMLLSQTYQDSRIMHHQGLHNHSFINRLMSYLLLEYSKLESMEVKHLALNI